jgi:hypothetical protein
MEHWWNDTDRGKQKYWERNLSQCQFVRHKSQIALVSAVTPATNAQSNGEPKLVDSRMSLCWPISSLRSGMAPQLMNNESEGAWKEVVVA